MLAADKDILVAGLKQNALTLRQKELEYHVERYSNNTTQARRAASRLQARAVGCGTLEAALLDRPWSEKAGLWIAPSPVTESSERLPKPRNRND